MDQPPSPGPTTTDSALLARYQASHAPEDLLPLYQQQAPFIYALCLKYLGTPERAEDAGAEIWLVLNEKLKQHEVINFKSWLHTLIRNHCLMQLRREKRDPLQRAAPALMQSEALLHQGAEPNRMAADTRPLHHCLKQLNEEQRQCIHLFYLQQGQTYQSIATHLGLTVGKVRSHLQNGRRNLRSCLEQQTNHYQ